MRISEARFLVIAAVFHAALPVMAAIAPVPEIEVETVPIEVDVEVDIEPTGPPKVVEMPAANAATPRANEEARPSVVERRTTPAGHVEPGPVPTALPTAEPGAEAAPPGEAVASTPAPGSTSEYDGPPPSVQTGPMTGIPGLGLGGPAWALPGVVPDMGRPAPAPTTTPRATVDPKIATKVLKDVLKEKDKSLGLDLPAGGTVASTVRSVVQAINTPTEARASFEVKLSPTGKVLSVRVASSTGGTAAMWAQAAKAVKAALSGRALAMTAGYEKGASVYVSVHSTVTLPDGSKSAIERKGVGATFDVANIGAHMQRVVKTSFSVAAAK